MVMKEQFYINELQGKNMLTLYGVQPISFHQVAVKYI